MRLDLETLRHTYEEGVREFEESQMMKFAFLQSADNMIGNSFECEYGKVEKLIVHDPNVKHDTADIDVLSRDMEKLRLLKVPMVLLVHLFLFPEGFWIPF